MSYRQQFDSTIRAVLDRSGWEDDRDLWPERLSEEGVDYGQEQDLAAEEAAAWYLSAAAMIRMQDGQLGVPLASRLLRGARRLARDAALSPELQDALDRMERERHEWIESNHEYQGAALRAIKPVDAGPDYDAEFVPSPNWPDLLERLLRDRSDAPT